MAKIDLTGMDELLKELYAIGEKVATRAENKALREGAEMLRQEISNRAPRKTGKLAANIVKTGVKIKNGVRYIEVGPGKNVFYGLYHELGTTKMPARPFIGPALEEKRSEVFSTMADVLRKEIEKRR